MAYAAKDFSNQLVAGQDYEHLTATVVIVWLVSPILDPPSRLHFSFSLREDTTHEPLTDLVRIHVLQLSACSGKNALRTAGITRLQRLLAKSFEATSLEETLERAGSGQMT